jgi:hypothetical protein
MVTAFQTKSRKAIAPAEMPESDRLEHLGATAKTIHREIEIMSYQASAEVKSRALDHAREAGEALHRAKTICKQNRKFNKTSPFWVTWVEAEIDFTYQTVCTYIRIHENWDLLRDMNGEERSIRGAVRYLRRLEGQTVEKKRKRKSAAIEESKFIALARQRASANSAGNSEQDLAFVNATLELARVQITLVFGKRKGNASFKGSML